MVRQYRNALERETLEIPAGGLNGREEPTDQAAMRELQEETGYHTDHVELLTPISTPRNVMLIYADNTGNHS